MTHFDHLDKKKEKKTLLKGKMSSFGDSIAYDIILAILSLFFIILGLILFILCKKKPVVDDVESSEETTLPIKLSANPYPLSDIDAATDGFNHRRIIGKGRLGTVYAAILPTKGGGEEELIAVKRIHPHLVLGNNASFGFSSVLKTLSLAHHPNIVSILGFSEAPGERIILMEFVGMVNLDFFLHQNSEDGGRSSLLDWDRRIKIAAGVAKGIEYLHEGMTPHVVHGCIKGSNILIDVKFCARVCDYGLSFLAPQEKSGVLGYVDDEYWVDKRGKGGCKESDVYGFGVVLLEILSGRRSEEGLIVKWATPLIKEMKFNELLDPRLGVPSDLKPLVRLGKVALACVGNSRKSRPSIVQVASILNNLLM